MSGNTTSKSAEVISTPGSTHCSKTFACFASAPHSYVLASRLQGTRDIRKLALLQLSLPEDRIGVHETVLNPPILLDVV